MFPWIFKWKASCDNHLENVSCQRRLQAVKFAAGKKKSSWSAKPACEQFPANTNPKSISEQIFTGQRGVLHCWESSPWSVQPAAWGGHVRALFFWMDRGRNSTTVFSPLAVAWKSCWMVFFGSLILSQPGHAAVLSTAIHYFLWHCRWGKRGACILFDKFLKSLSVFIHHTCLTAPHSLGCSPGGITVPPCTWSCCCSWRGSCKALCPNAECSSLSLPCMIN